MTHGALALAADAIAQLDHCNKCGFCLPACPTYVETGLEVHSPRGRLSLIEAAWRGELAVGQPLADALSLCVGCRACEVACPSGVQYSIALQAAQADLVRRRRRWVVSRAAVPPLLALVRHRRALKAAVRLGQAAKRIRLLPVPLAPLAAMLPPTAEVPSVLVPIPADPAGPAVHFVDTCVMDALFPTANQHARALLSAGGAHLQAAHGPEGCCGALEAHTGHPAKARELARAHVVRWERDLPPDTWIVAHAGGCAAMMADYGRLLADDARWTGPARRWAGQVRDWAAACAVLPHALAFRGTGARVALQNSCHAVSALGQGAAPAELLARVAGDQLVTLPGQDRCCGAGGVYNLSQPAMAQQILRRHLDEAAAADVDVWVATNPGCALHLGQGVRATAGRAAVVHLATYLHERWQADPPAPPDSARRPG